MKLCDYLKSENVSETTFAAAVGVGPKAVRHWLNGERMPRPAQLERIIEATNGKVSADDFLFRGRTRDFCDEAPVP